MPIKRAIFDKKNILIIGGAGFVGSHLCDELVQVDKVICIDNFLTGSEENISHLLENPNFKFINHDIVNLIDLEKQSELRNFKVEFQGVQEIYYLASPASPKAYTKLPIESLLDNSVGLRNALDLAVKYKAQFFYASSSTVYGDTSDKKIVKEDYFGPQDHLAVRAVFSEAKRFGETLVQSYRLKYDLDAKIARIFNCYGPRLKLSDGRMIPEMIRQAISGEDITVYGDEKSFGSYFYISDLIKVITKLMHSPEFGPVNLASDWKNTYSEIAQKIIAITKAPVKIKYEKPLDYMGEQSIADITLAKEALGWFPVVLLDEGLKKTIDYLSAQKDIEEPEQLIK